MEGFIGSVVSVQCGDVLGTFQGFVDQIDSEQQTLTLCDPFCNGLKGQVPSITINASDIRDLKIIHSKDEAKTIPKVNHIHKPSKSSDLKQQRCQSDTSTASNHAEKDGKLDVNKSRPGKEAKGWVSPRKNEARSSPRRPNKREDCFSSPVASYVNDEFDFEKNLALFDKQAVFAAIENKNESPMKSRTPNREQKYRCDENVIASKPAVFKQIHTQCSDGGSSYVTDSGLVVPSVSQELRQTLLLQAEKVGLSAERQTEAVGRSAAEMLLQLIGGNHRLTPQNAHQRPSVVVLCGHNSQGAEALNCARHLSMHTVHVTVFVPPEFPQKSPLRNELNLLKLTSAKIVVDPSDLPTTAVEIIVSGLDGHHSISSREQWMPALTMWAAQMKAPVLVIDPPVRREGVFFSNPKWGLSIALPLHGAHSTCTQMYLCDLSLPTDVFKKASVTYASPFGHKFVIPIYVN